MKKKKFEFDPVKNEVKGLILMIVIFFGGTLLLNMIVWSFIGGVL